jgi:hypothetical protein
MGKTIEEFGINLETIREALRDAIDYREDHGEFCGDCELAGREYSMYSDDDREQMCEDHQGDLERADRYAATLATLNSLIS